MVATSSIASAFAAAKCSPRSRNEGLQVAFAFLAVNWLLDLLVVVPLLIPEGASSCKRFHQRVSLNPAWDRGCSSDDTTGVCAVCA
jgi:hypothetical protein